MKKVVWSLLLCGSFCFAESINPVLDEITLDEQSSQEVKTVLRKMDDDLKEGLACFAGLMNGIFQIVDGKENSERSTIVNGVNQFIGSLVDILMIGQKRNGLHTINNKEELQKLLLWALRIIEKETDQN